MSDTNTSQPDSDKYNISRSMFYSKLKHIFTKEFTLIPFLSGGMNFNFFLLLLLWNTAVKTSVGLVKKTARHLFQKASFPFNLHCHSEDLL